MSHEEVGYEVSVDRAHFYRGWVHLDCSCGQTTSARWEYFPGEPKTWMCPGNGPEVHLHFPVRGCPLAHNEQAFADRVEDHLTRIASGAH